MIKAGEKNRIKCRGEKQGRRAQKYHVRIESEAASHDLWLSPKSIYIEKEYISMI